LRDYNIDMCGVLLI